MQRRIDITPRESASLYAGGTYLYKPVTIRVAEESAQTLAEIFLSQGNVVAIWPDEVAEERKEEQDDEGAEVQDAEA